MSYMRGDLLTKTRKLVKGLAKPAPTWLKAMEQSVLPRSLAPHLYFRHFLIAPRLRMCFCCGRLMLAR
jgi:hypothetical protein